MSDTPITDRLCRLTDALDQIDIDTGEYPHTMVALRLTKAEFEALLRESSHLRTTYAAGAAETFRGYPFLILDKPA